VLTLFRVAEIEHEQLRRAAADRGVLRNELSSQPPGFTRIGKGSCSCSGIDHPPLWVEAEPSAVTQHGIERDSNYALVARKKSCRDLARGFSENPVVQHPSLQLIDPGGEPLEAGLGLLLVGASQRLLRCRVAKQKAFSLYFELKSLIAKEKVNLVPAHTRPNVLQESV
jgi:hypothetical protein